MKKERVLSLPLPLRSSLLPLPLLCLFLVTIKFVVEKVINYSGVISPQAKHIDPEMAMSQLVNVSISSRDSYCIDVVLRCLAITDDGLEPHHLNDGGILGTIMAAGFKEQILATSFSSSGRIEEVIPFLSIGTITGELPRFQAGVTMEISCLDAWYSDKDGTLECRATYIVKGLCRRCCLPEVILRCMQVSVSLMGSGVLPDCHDTLIELVGSPETDFLHLFSQQQLQARL
ncbi:Nuclear pore complex protein NUP107 [Glycine soja]|uniref:Nuclear pore complex protein NUP107 n=1 Tax=Glycine soja TaxID=3848 RepID=A0A445GCV8_GLYSO|nr:Nuclear pore complex protein NUP107 [Glycine soja]